MHLAADGLVGVSRHCEAYCEGLSGPQPSQGRASAALPCGYNSLGRAPSALSSILHAALVLAALSRYDVALQPTLPNSTVVEFLYSVS